MSVNLQDGSADSGADAGISCAKVFSCHHTSWSVHSSVPLELLEIPSTKNHTATPVGSEVYVFGGYDGQKNHNELCIFDLQSMEWRQPSVGGQKPSGRNGHSATLLAGGAQILILGGWLGNGPLAAGDMHLLNLEPLKWVPPRFTGEPPGPCNMHTADLVARKLLVFRGGDGRAYLNDLHGLDLDSNSWFSVKTSGEQPPPRANHASAVDDYRLYIFGGWDGTKRLNDLYVLDNRDSVWTMLKPTGYAPQARAGMTLSIIRDCLYLFGGSGHTTRCFNDVHVYDPEEQADATLGRGGWAWQLPVLQQAWFLCVQSPSESVEAVPLYLAALLMPSIPEIFKMNSGDPEDEAAEEPCEDVEQPSLEESDHQVEIENGPPRTCMGLTSAWLAKELSFTRAASPTEESQRMDDGDSPPGQHKALSRRQRRRQRLEQQKAGGPPGPPSEPDTHSENPESDYYPDFPEDLVPCLSTFFFRTYRRGTTDSTTDGIFDWTGPSEGYRLPGGQTGSQPLTPRVLELYYVEVEDGTGKGVKWRGGTPPQPPTWRYDHQDPRAYSKYAKKVALWRIQVASYMSPREAALLLYTSLTGEAETELEHAPIESINTDSGIDFILETLRTPMEQKLVFQKRKFLNEYENIQRQPNEALRAYSNRYRRAERNLRAVGIEVAQMYDDDSRGNRLLDRARLSPADQRLILVGSRYSLAFEQIAESMHMQYPEFKAAPAIFGRDGQPLNRKGDGKGKDGAAAHPAPWQSSRPPKGGHGGKGGAPRRVYLTEQAEENALDDIPEEHTAEAEPDEPDEEDAVTEEAPPDESETDAIAQAAEVLTVTAKKLSGMKLGRKFSGQPNKDVAAQKRTTHCAVCGQLGHWKGDPAFYMRDFGSLEVTDAEPPEETYGSVFQINVVFDIQADVPLEPGFQDLMILDTACQRTCCGLDWAKEHTERLLDFGLKPRTIACADAFQFGAGRPITARTRTYFPTGLGGADLLIAAGTLDAKIPLLASNRLLDALGMVLDMPNSSMTFTNLCVTGSPSWRALQDGVDWNDPPPELVVQGDLGAAILDFRKNFFVTLTTAVRLGMIPDTVYEAVPPELDTRFAHPAGTCPHPDYVRYGNAYGKFARCKQCLRLQAARFAAALAVFLQYCASGFSGGSIEPVPAYQDGFPLCSNPQEIRDGEAFYTSGTAKQRQRDGDRPLAADQRGDGLQLGRSRRLKGDWKRSAKILEREVGMYNNQPSAQERAPHTVDLFVIYPDRFDIQTAAAELEMTSTMLPLTIGERLPGDPSARQHAHRALRRLRPHVLYLSFLDRAFGNDERGFVEELFKEQTASGRAVVMLGPAGPRMKTLGQQPGANTCNFGDGPGETTLITTVPGATSWFSTASPRNLDRKGFLDPLLGMIRNYVRSRDPSRFGIYQAFVTYRSPVTRLEEWDEIAETLARSFGAPGTRPFYIDPGSELGRNVADLFRIKLEKAQAVQTPSQRRLPQDVPFTARGAFLVHNDGTKTIELEDLSLVHQPKQRFAKPVRYGLLVYGHLIPEEESQKTAEPGVPISGLPTDVSFPGLSNQVPVEVRRSIARAHINMGHPTAEELIRMANAAGTPSSMFIEAIRKLECATCSRLKGPQAPRPAASTITATQFGDRVEVDMFYLRDLQGRSCMVLGAVDSATRFHQAAVLKSRDPEDAYEALEAMWLRPFGLMVQIGLDPDTTFQGAFQERLRSRGVMVDYCPAEAHWQIGQVERQNAFLRTVLEKLVDTFAAAGVEDIRLLLAPALHAVNSMTLSRGRSAFQAVFGRVPRLPGGLFTDYNSLTTTPTDDPAATAEIIRSEALKTICDMNVRQSFRRALLRKTQNTKGDGSLHDSSPGTPRPAAPTKMAWVRSGTTTALVAVEQLRAATGFEAWLPTEPDVAALKDASQKLDQSLWADESGPPPSARDQLNPEADFEQDVPMMDRDRELTAALASAPTPPVVPTTSPTTPSAPLQPQTNVRVEMHDQSFTRSDTLVYQPTVQNTFVRNTARNVCAKDAWNPVESATNPPEPQQLPEELPEPPVPPVPVTPLEVGWESAPFESAGYDTDFEPEVPLPEQPEQRQQPAGVPQQELEPQALSSAPQAAAGSARDSSDRPPTTPVTSGPSTPSVEPPGLLPAKRTFDALTTLFFDEDVLYHRVPGDELAEGHGPMPHRAYEAYLSSEHRADDLHNDTKDPRESDTSDTDWEDQPPGKKHQGMTRAEAKALDREIPWRKILELDQPDIQAYVKAVEKEAKSWEEWGSVKALSHQEAHRILRDRILSKRVLRTRSCFRDKSKGLGELRAKCRVVALGHKDPDIYKLNRECVTPNRVSEHVLFIILVSGSNGEFGENKKRWSGWSGDASTAFLQGDISSSERDMPLYLLPPSDGVTELTSCWKAPLYLVCTNVYGLSNAPRLWSLTVIKRLCDLGYRQHSFDKMVFVKFDAADQLVSIIIVYVDDFLGAYRSDYNVDEVHKAFKWGSLETFRPGQAVTFKGKQITLRQRANGRCYLHVCQKEFIEGMTSGKIPRGADPDAVLSTEQRAEFRSVTGCLQWISGQSRPKSPRSTACRTTEARPRSTTFAPSTRQSTSRRRLKRTALIPDVPVNKASVVLSFSDASWANAEHCRSQCGVLVLLCGPTVLQRPAPAMLLDWRSCRSTRVCRSTLAAEASASDEGCDRAAYVNLQGAATVAARMVAATAGDTAEGLITNKRL
ncbi:LZTR1 [Symbiodinium necroappetens]|uniref:LZTR1 protein n=1 Tax=Symbiodinium necroappetens TaxID=1628268 RepID=A0A812K9D1_9DINO|nr:LZTR1 [Symbiodinium necroappetens]